ncbi:MAG: ribbon-helix-helix protein, CopG family [Magnetococcales bacterium]|nr:ribbon-helix-helix protein, CopG family [Magnetococcales bacterium]
METVSIQLPDDVLTRLQDLVRVTGGSVDAYILEAIQDYLEDLEDLPVAERRLADIRAGRSGTCTLEEVERSLGLAD